MKRLLWTLAILLGLAAYMAALVAAAELGMWLVGAPWGAFLPLTVAAPIGAWWAAGVLVSRGGDRG